MTRPWTAIVKDKSTGQRSSMIFQGGFGTGEAADYFKNQHGFKMTLEVLIPGSHSNVYIEKV